VASDRELDDAARAAMIRLLLVQYEEDLRAIYADKTLSRSQRAYRKTNLRWRYKDLVR